MLIPRIITGVVLLAAVFFLFFFASPNVFFVAISLLLAWSSWEWSRLIGLTVVARRLFLVAFYLLMAMAMFWLPVGILLIAFSVWWCLVFIILLFYARGRALWAKKTWVGVLMGIPTLGSSYIGFNVLRHFDQVSSASIVFYFVLLIAAMDTCAYFVGRAWGKRKLAPTLSPNKTWEGLLGGVVGSIIVALAASMYFEFSAAVTVIFVVISLLAALFSVVGDLFISLLKRQQHLKDTGNILPGHGGLLDRLDGLNGGVSIFTLGLILLTLSLK